MIDYTPIYIYEGEEECYSDGTCTPPLYWTQAESEVEAPSNISFEQSEINKSWNATNVLEELTPDTVIEDLNEFLKCYDTTKPAVVTIYADQPLQGSSTPIEDGEVGHAFISISQNGKISTFGFYPNADGVSRINAPSIIGNNGGDPYDVSVSITVSGSILKKVIDQAKDYKDRYDVNFYNCTNYARNLGITAGINIPSAYGFFPGGGGQNPGKLGEVIRAMSSSNEISVNKTPSNAPSKDLGCN